MPTFDIEYKEITVFEFVQMYLSKQHFDEFEIYRLLEQNYNSIKYRSEVAQEKFPKINQISNNFFYDLEVADQPRKYRFVRIKKVNSSDMLRSLVAHQCKGSYNIFLMKDDIRSERNRERRYVTKKRDLNTDGYNGNRRIVAEPMGAATVDTSIFHNGMINKSLSNEH